LFCQADLEDRTGNIVYLNMSAKRRKDIKKQAGRQDGKKEYQREQQAAPCMNKDCRLRSAGCKGFAGCPGYKGR
jgi:hypothetical protein